ncbi:hypothetical protein COO60DRAFT_1545697 [Scenedesmus sp. NREL 46B-D3]|nr:hypothetical protein COO60DRAFT_1545697 [Scenedesmus sp. NREL 46B-D3]
MSSPRVVSLWLTVWCLVVMRASAVDRAVKQVDCWLAPNTAYLLSLVLLHFPQDGQKHYVLILAAGMQLSLWYAVCACSHRQLPALGTPAPPQWHYMQLGYTAGQADGASYRSAVLYAILLASHSHL